MEFQAFLSWFSPIRLLLDECEIAGKPTTPLFCRRGVISQVESSDWPEAPQALLTAIRNRGGGATAAAHGRDSEVIQNVL